MDLSYLKHHGIKGMKWGQRRYQNKDGTLTPEGVKRYQEMGADEDYIKSRSKATHQMSDKELQITVSRVRNEQEYARLTAKQKNPWLEAIEKAAREAMTESIKNVASHYAKAYSKKGIDALIKLATKKVVELPEQSN